MAAPMHRGHAAHTSKMAKPTTSRSTPKQSSWLPSQRPQLLLTQPLNLKYIKSHKPHDWFLSLAWELDEGQRTDMPQGRKLARAYLFLRDFMPQGLSGPRAHISGNDLMRYLLSDSNESAKSRHKLTRDAELAFTELEKWMQRTTSWEDALRDAKHADEDADGRAPGLHSPAGMLAVLVLSYPDAKFIHLFARLQIQWMLDPRETLAVTEGFWKGINASNLEQVFQPEPVREAKSKLCINYDQILGAQFLDCRKDMRCCLPSLPPYVQHLALEGSPDLSDLADVEQLADRETTTDNPAVNTTGRSNTHKSAPSTVSSSSLSSPGLLSSLTSPVIPHESGIAIPLSPLPRTPTGVTNMAPLSPGHTVQGTPASIATVLHVSAPPTGLFARWAGQTSTKRLRSQERDTPSKIPRLADWTQQEFRDERKLEREELKTELYTGLQTGLATERQRLTTEILADIKAELVAGNERLEASLQAKVDHLKTALQTDFKGLLDTTQVTLKTFGGIVKEVKGKVRAAQQSTALTQAIFEEITAKIQHIVASNEAATAMVKNELDCMKGLLAKPPQLGEAGYLTQCCPAPEGMDQRAYESQLLRAGYCFINTLGDPDGGVADQEAVESMNAAGATSAKFPDIPEGHLETAIQHVHMQAYGRTLA